MEEKSCLTPMQSSPQAARKIKRKKSEDRVRFSQREREIFIWFKNYKDPHTGKKVFTYEAIAECPHAPKERTLRRWIQESKIEPPLKKRRAKTGPKPKLTEVEKLVLGGWAIISASHGEAVTIEKIRGFIFQAFGVELQKSSISSTMNYLGFTSRKTQETSLPRDNLAIHDQMTKFLHQCRSMITQYDSLSRVVVMDVKSFWTQGAIARSYALRGA